MARIRTIKPEFWTSEQIADCSPIARLLFIGMWNFCDDGGNHPASCRTLKMQIFPGDDFTTADIEGFVAELVSADLLVEYEAEGKRYWNVTGWKHQKIEKPSYKYPRPVQEHSAPTQQHVAEDSPTTRRMIDDDQPAEGNGREWKGKELESTKATPLVPKVENPNAGALGELVTQEQDGKTQEQDGKTQEHGSETDKRKRACQLPKDFEPNGQHIALASELGIDLSAEFASFKDFHTAKGSVFKDWDAALRTWIRNAHRFSRAAPTGRQSARPGVMHTGINKQDFSDVPQVDNLGI